MSSGDGAMPDRGLQAERTALAWMRTGLLLAATCVLAIRIAIVTDRGVATIVAACVLVIVSLLLSWHGSLSSAERTLPISGVAVRPGLVTATSLLVLLLALEAAALLLAPG